jgi:hypothetical protein
MDIIRLYQDFGIDFKTEGHKHARAGWVNTECPFCSGNPGLHLGWNIADEYFLCWRCGWHPPVITLSELLHLPFYEIYPIIEQYGVNRTILQHRIEEKRKFEFPSGTSYLKPSHKKYLINRGFDPNKLQERWFLSGTGPFSKLGSLSYKFRIIIPFYWNGEIVSFDSRDITDKQQNRYQACPAEYESVGHKQILYGDQEAWNPKIGICVEGPTDVWRLGELAFATSGIKYTESQVKIMASIFKRIAVVYDDDPQAQVQAKKLVDELKLRDVNAWNIQIKGDPGDLTQKEARELLKLIRNDKTKI